MTRDQTPAAALRVVEWLTLATLAAVLARLIWAVVTPVTPLGDWQPPALAAARVDRSIIGSFDPFFRQQADEGTAAVSSGGMTLVGTRVDTVSGRGSAIIATGDGVQASFLVGETVQPGVILRAVGFDSVTLDRSGTPEKLFLDQSAGTAPITPESAGIAPGGTAPRLAADVQVTPRLQGSTITGYVLTPKGSGAAFAAAGLEPGDVLVSVDGNSLTSLGDPATLARQLDAGGIEISVERGGRIVKLRIGGPK
jgi:general secretion pathway protein C